MLHPRSTEKAGDEGFVYEYAAVVDPHVPALRGKYASSNFFTVSGEG